MSNSYQDIVTFLSTNISNAEYFPSRLTSAFDWISGVDFGTNQNLRQFDPLNNFLLGYQYETSTIYQSTKKVLIYALAHPELPLKKIAEDMGMGYSNLLK